jgi:hypothetical protein
MNDDEISKDEEGRLLELLQQTAMYSFPNPDRIGCPGPEFLKRLALDRTSIPIDDPRLTHVSRCSPCFRELTAIRTEAEKRSRFRRLAFIAAAVIVCAALGAWKFLNSQATGPASGTYVAASLDLKNRSVVRGAEPAQTPNVDSLRLPRERLSLTITLPFASEPGTYEVQILRELGRSLVTAAGQAHFENGVTSVNVRLDLARLPSGPYLVGIRRVPLDWTFHPVVIR